MFDDSGEFLLFFSVRTFYQDVMLNVGTDSKVNWMLNVLSDVNTFQPSREGHGLLGLFSDPDLYLV